MLCIMLSTSLFWVPRRTSDCGIVSSGRGLSGLRSLSVRSGTLGQPASSESARMLAPQSKLRSLVMKNSPGQRPLLFLLMRRGQCWFVALVAAANVLLKFALELANQRLHRPARAVGEAADRRTGHDTHAVADFFENLEVYQTPPAVTHTIGDL